MHHDQANVTFIAQSAVTRDAIEQALPRLRESFAQNGLELTNADVSQQSFGQSGENNQEEAGLNSGAMQHNLSQDIDISSDQEQKIVDNCRQLLKKVKNMDLSDEERKEISAKFTALILENSQVTSNIKVVVAHEILSVLTNENLDFTKFQIVEYGDMFKYGQKYHIYNDLKKDFFSFLTKNM